MTAAILSRREKLYIVITYKNELNKTMHKWFGTGLDDTKSNRKKAEPIRQQKLKEFKETYKFLERGSGSTLFADYILQWLERSKANLQISTYSTYVGQVNNIAEYFRAKNISLIDLQPIDIANYYAYLQKQGKSIQLCEHYHVNIRRALQMAVRANLIPYNPADRIDRPRSPKHIAQYYNREQLDELFKALEGDDYAYIYKMTAYYGLRRSEMMGIKWSNIDFKNNVLILRHAVVQTRLNGKSIIVAKDRMKNNSSLRTLPLIPKVRDLLLKLKEQQEKNKQLYGEQYEHKYDDYIVVDDLGYRRNPDTISSHFKLVLKRNGLPRIKFHELRHSCASLLLEEGVGMKEIQEWLGHSTYTTTADIYSHLDYRSKNKVANIINHAFDETENETELNEILQDNAGRDEEFEIPKPRHMMKYKHRENPKTQEISMDQTIPDLDKELEELEELIQLKKSLLNKKKNFEM